MSKTVIPAGYRLTVVSWENDADNYKTEVMEGLELTHITFLVDVCKLMANRTDHCTRVCNIYDPSDEERSRVYTALANVARRHPEYMKHIGADEDSTDEFIGEHMLDVLHELGLAYTGEYFTRVCSQWKVEYTPFDITLTNVTKEFA